MKIKYLTEETLDAAANAAKRDVDNAQVEDSAAEGDIEKLLDRCLKASKRSIGPNKKNRQFVNALLVGPAGTGKTSRVRAWADARGLKLVYKDVKTMDLTDLGGAISPDKEGQSVDRLATKEFDQLMEPNTVLFLDEFNRADGQVRATLLTLINDHMIPDPREEGQMRYLPGFIFTVAAINPPNPNYNTDNMDAAERSRFLQVNVTHDKQVALKYLTKKFNADLKEYADDPEETLAIKGRLKLAQTLLSSKDFKFDEQADEDRADMYGGSILNERTFATALEACDGTKADLIDIWPGICNKDKLGMVELILANYEDVQDKANSVFGDNNAKDDDDDDTPAFGTSNTGKDDLDKIFKTGIFNGFAP